MPRATRRQGDLTGLIPDLTGLIPDQPDPDLNLQEATAEAIIKGAVDNCLRANVPTRTIAEMMVGIGVGILTKAEGPMAGQEIVDGISVHLGLMAEEMGLISRVEPRTAGSEVGPVPDTPEEG